jgi:hypothetical protein
MLVRLGRCLHGRVEYIPLGRYVRGLVYGKSGFLVWQKSGLDRIKVDGVIFIRIIRSMAVRG